jgi:WD40 repeat protein
VNSGFGRFPNTVGEYNATTGATINANFITGLSDALGLALSGDGTALFVTNPGNNTVGEYNATTGAAINANFITGLSNSSGLALSDDPLGLALSGDGTALFVANTGNNTVGKYNATTGAAINAKFITGLSAPWGIALSGNNLFIANSGSTIGNNTVSEYNAITGAAINANFITGLTQPTLLALGRTPTPQPTLPLIPTKELVWENTVTGERSIWVHFWGEFPLLVGKRKSRLLVAFPRFGDFVVVMELMRGGLYCWLMPVFLPVRSDDQEGHDCEKEQKSAQ